jgi:hypothetical protein
MLLMQKIAPIFLILAATATFAVTHVYETDDAKVTIEISSAENSNILDFTAIPPIQNEDALELWICLADKITGQELDMPISLSNLKEFISGKNLSWHGNIEQRNVALFKALFHECKVTRLSLADNPNPLKKKTINNAEKE